MTGRTAVGPVCAVRALGGVAMLVRPAEVCRAYGHRPTSTAQQVVRVLGARHVVQAAVTLARPGSVTTAGGAAVDLAHAATALLWAGTAPERRRPGRTSAAMATLLAVASGQAYRRVRAAGRSRGVRPPLAGSTAGGSLRLPPSPRERVAP